MILRKSLLFKPVFRSLLPLLVGSGCYLLKSVLLLNIFQKHHLDGDLNSSGINQGFNNHEINPNDITSNMLLDFLVMLSQISFGIYKNYLAFLFVMLLTEIIFRIIQNEGKYFSTSGSASTKSVERISLEALKSGERSKLLKKMLIQMVVYTMIFIVFHISGYCINIADSSISLSNPSSIITMTEQTETMIMSVQHNNPLPLSISRMLEEEERGNSIPVELWKSEKASLDMGNIMSSLDIVVTGMVLSATQRYAFVTIELYGTLKIIDLRDLKYPTIVGSLALKQPGNSFNIKALVLSQDEKTLFISNSRYLEIVDVTTVEYPKLISQTNSKFFAESIYDMLPVDFKTSLAFDENTKTLFIGGLGLQVYDVSNPKKPILLKALKNDLEYERALLTTNGICLSADGKALLVANGTLDVYDISDPKEIKLINSIETKSFGRSIFLSKLTKKAFLLGKSEDEQMILEEVDISNLKTPSSVKSYSLGPQDGYSANILATSPGETKFYIKLEDYLFVFDTIKRKVIENEGTLIKDTYTMSFSAGGTIMITGSNDQFRIVELFLNFPNSEIFGTSNNVISNFSSGTTSELMHVSSDSQTLFVTHQDDEAKLYSVKYRFEIWNVKNKSSPQILSMIKYDHPIKQMRFTKNYETVYLVGLSDILVLDISDRSNPKMREDYKFETSEFGRIRWLEISSDERIGFTQRHLNQNVYISMINLSDLSKNTIEVLGDLDKNFTINCRLILKDDDTLIVLDEEISIFDVSNPRAPKEIALIPFAVNEPSPSVHVYLLSPDKKTLFVETNENNFYKLRIYDVSNRTFPQFLSEKPLTKWFTMNDDKPEFSLSSDGKSGFVLQDNFLVRIDLTDLKQPRISGIVPLNSTSRESVKNYVLSPDGKAIYASIEMQDIRVLESNIKYTLYLKKEKFLLGEKYSDNIALLGLNDEYNYDLMDAGSYKIIKLSLFDIKTPPNKNGLEITSSSLPSWMSFHRQNNLLTFEPKKQRDLGTYTFYSAFSFKIPRNIFDALLSGQSEKEDQITSDDLFAWLISLDYVDTKLFLTENFGSFQDFILPSKFEKYKPEIYEKLKQFYMETCTGFEIISSLKLNDYDYLEISTPNSETVKVEIKLHAKEDSEAFFLNKPYASLLPVIKDGKSQLSLEGTLTEIDAALDMIVVDFSGPDSENIKTCPATLTISDGLNPSLTREIKNILNYFKQNNPPRPNKPIQGQIDHPNNNVYTGQYFAISLQEDTFIDDHWNASLSYEIAMPSNKTALPNWLSLNELTLRGTPPEEIFGREIDLVMIAKNEFKQYRVPFKLHIKISSGFLLKLLVRYSPYILTLIGFLVSLNKILNIIGKDWYKHPKEYVLNVGEDVSASEMIFPITFIKEQTKQSQLILKYFHGWLDDFIDQDGVLNKQKIIDAIQKTLKEMPVVEREKISLESIPLIEKIIINKFVDLQINSPRELKTKSLFEDLKSECLEVIEKDGPGFMVNQAKLNKLLKKTGISRSQENNLEESFIPSNEIKMELLKDAIIAYAFEIHSVNELAVDVDIVFKQKIQTGFLFKLLKFDLRPISFNDRNKIDYGWNYKIFDEKLWLYGTVKNTFKGKTVVLQIMNIRHKILKEIWIHGTSDPKDFLIKDDHEAQDQGYEIF